MCNLFKREVFPWARSYVFDIKWHVGIVTVVFILQGNGAELLRTRLSHRVRFVPYNLPGLFTETAATFTVSKSCWQNPNSPTGPVKSDPECRCPRRLWRVWHAAYVHSAVMLLWVATTTDRRMGKFANYWNQDRGRYRKNDVSCQWNT